MIDVSLPACDPERRMNSDGRCFHGLCTGEIHWKTSVSCTRLHILPRNVLGTAPKEKPETLLVYGGAVVMQRYGLDKEVSLLWCFQGHSQHIPAAWAKTNRDINIERSRVVSN